MNKETLRKSNELCELIEQTEYALKDLEVWLEKLKNYKVSSGDQKKEGFTPPYTLHVSEFSDGSGFRLDMGGYHNNQEFLLLTKQFLEKRLAKYTVEFENL